MKPAFICRFFESTQGRNGNNREESVQNGASQSKSNERKTHSKEIDSAMKLDQYTKGRERQSVVGLCTVITSSKYNYMIREKKKGNISIY